MKLRLAGDLVLVEFDANVRQLRECSSRPPGRTVNDSVLMVQAKDYSFDDVRRVIGSIEALRE